MAFTLILEVIGGAVHHCALNELNTQTQTRTHTPLLLLQLEWVLGALLIRGRTGVFDTRGVLTSCLPQQGVSA